MMHRMQAGGEGSGVVTTAACGECCVTTRWLGFYRVWQGSGEVFDAVDLFLPDVQFNTQARGPWLAACRRLVTCPLHLAYAGAGQSLRNSSPD